MLDICWSMFDYLLAVGFFAQKHNRGEGVLFAHLTFSTHGDKHETSRIRCTHCCRYGLFGLWTGPDPGARRSGHDQYRLDQ